ncbi:hypothetical protein SNE40_003124 [Patella caerulea]|uniref:Transmembrane protein 199 n=2 Tax=Patella caerulea TaxID=87958 RepID=A0AAN8K768_PATCE
MENYEPEVILTKKIKNYASTVVHCDGCGERLKHELKTILGNENKKTITFDLVKKIRDFLVTENEDLYLHTMLDESDLHLPTITPPTRNPELEARVQKLRNEQANREYKEMTRNVNLSERCKTDTFGEEIKSLNRQMIAVFNFIVTVGAGFAFGYKTVEYSVGYSLPMQMMCGLIFGTLVFFADLYFLLKHTA